MLVNGERIRDPALRVAADALIEMPSRQRYVSRGGEKLHAALEEWSAPVRGKVFLDAGASTGGFTDCLLQFGARAVHAVDVGYNQLDYRLRRDSRVIVHERTNLMHLESLDPPADAAVADLSFRSLRGAARKLLSLSGEGWAIVLVKPQFEFASALKRAGAGRSPGSRGRGRSPVRGRSAPRDVADFNSATNFEAGVVRDPDVLQEILLSLRRDLAADGITVQGELASPVAGRRGNREFLFLLTSGVSEYQPKEERSSGEPM